MRNDAWYTLKGLFVLFGLFLFQMLPILIYLTIPASHVVFELWGVLAAVGLCFIVLVIISYGNP